MKIKDLQKNTTMGGIRFIYPGDGKEYYWHSQWAKGVWGKLKLTDERIYPLFVEDLKEALEWEAVK